MNECEMQVYYVSNNVIRLEIFQLTVIVNRNTCVNVKYRENVKLQKININ